MNFHLCRTFLITCFLLFVQITFGQTTAVLEEDFEISTGGIPLGWDLSSSTIGTYNNFKHFVESENGCIQLDANSSTSGQNNVGDKAVLMSPSFSLITDHILTFRYKTYRTPECDFSLYISTDGGLTYEDNSLQEAIEKNSEWTTLEYDLRPYTGTSAAKLVFVVELTKASSYHEVYIDDVKVSSFPLCAEPINFSVMNVQPTSVDLSWQIHQWGSVPTKYNVLVYDENNNTVVNVEDTLLAMPMIGISGLEAATSYTARIQSNCEEASKGVSVWSEDISFTTLCSYEDLPYEINFDSESGIVPTCWDRGGSNSSNVKLQSTISTSGKALELNATSTKDARATTPLLSHAMDDMEISFNVYGEDIGKTYTIAVMTDILDVSSAIPIYTGTILKKEEWHQVVFNTSGNLNLASINSAHIGFYLPTGATNTVVFDDLRITTVPSCLRPDSLAVSNITYKSATFAWETEQSSQDFELRFTSNGTEEIVAATSMPFTYGMLSASTSYEVSVRQKCTGSEVSEWSVPVKFQTECSPVVTLPFFESFDNTLFPPSCWKSRELVYAGSNYGDANWMRTTTLSYRHSGAGAAQLRLTKKGTVTVLSLPPMTISAANMYELRFWMYRDSNNDNEGLEIIANTSFDTVGAVSLGYIDRDYREVPAESEKGYYQYSFPISLSGEQVFIMFKGKSNYGTNTYIDDVEVREIPSCPVISDISLDTVTETTIAYEWIAGGSETQWEVGYKLNAFQSDYTTITVTEPRVEISNLRAGTPYNVEIRVKALCASDDHSEGVSLSQMIVTNCTSQSLPYSENFEQATNLSGTTSWAWVTPLCWTVNKKNTSTYPSVQASTTFTKEMALDKTNSVSTGLLNVDTWVGKRMRLDLRTEKNTYSSAKNVELYVRISEDASGVNAIVVDTIVLPNDSEKRSYVVLFGQEYAGRYIQLEAKSVNSKKIWVDNLVLEELPTCPDVNGLAVDNIDTTSAQISILTTIGSTGTCDVEYGVAPLSENATRVISTSTFTSVDLTNLMPDTEYEVRVRNSCSSSDKGSWSDVVSFRTKCVGFVVSSASPFFEGFESGQVDKSLVAGCWTQNSINGDEGWMANSSLTSYGTKPHEGEFAAYIYPENEVYMYKALRLKSGVNYKFSCFTRKGSSSSSTSSTYAVEFKVYLSNSSTTLDALILEPTLQYSNTKYFEVSEFFTVPSDGTYYLAVGGIGAKYNRVMVDNIKVEEVTCGVVSGNSIVFPKLTQDSAIIKWSNVASEYNVKVSSASIDPTEDVADIFDGTVRSDSVILGALSSITKYYYYIQSNCGTSLGDWTQEKTFKTECASYDIPYFENFDGTTSSFECWNAMGDNAATKSKPLSSMPSAYAMKFTNGVYMASPAFNVSTLANYQLRAKVYATNDNAQIAIGVSNSQTDITEFIDISPISVPTKNTWTEVVVYFNELLEPGFEDYRNAKHIVLVVSDEHTIFVDDINVELLPTCPQPASILFENIGDKSLTMSWTSNEGSSWRAIVKEKESGVVVVDSILNSIPATLYGLTPNTNYTLDLISICSENDSSRSANIEFTTICSPLYSTPFFENFENFDGREFACWTNTSSSTSTYETYWWHISDEDVPSNAASYKASNNKGQWGKLTTPAIDLKTLAAAELTFDYMNSRGGVMNVYVSTTDNTVENALLVTLNNAIDNFTLQKVNLNSYCGKEIILTFQAVANKVSSYSCDPFIRIDNVSVDEAETCFAPASISHIESNSFGIKVAVESETLDNIWELALVPSNLDITSLEDSEINIITTTSDTVVFTEFNGSTRYYAAVRRVCGDERSTWVRSSLFASECLPMAVPYINDFEDVYDFSEVLCMDQRGWGAYSSSYPKADITDYLYLIEGKKSLMLKSAPRTSLFMFLPEFSNSIDSLNLSFKYEYESMSDLAGVLSIGLVPSTMDTTQFIKIADLERFLEPQEVNFDLRHAGVQGTDYRIVFRYTGTGKYDKRLVLDDIKVTKSNTCVSPLKVDIINIEMTTVDVFIHDDISTQWEIAYGEIGTSFEDLTVVSNVTERLSQLDNVSSAKEYELYVRSVCGDHYSEWSSKETFVTGCDIITISDTVAYVEDFDSYNEGIIPFCWTLVKGHNDDLNGHSYPTIYDGKENTEPNSFKFSCMNGTAASENIVALPEFNVPLNSTQLSFLASGGSNRRLIVGYTDNLEDINSFVDVYEFEVSSSTLKLYVADLTILPSSAKYIYFRIKNTLNDLYIDDVRLAVAPLCSTPKDVVLESQTHEHTATFTYRSSEASRKVELEYVNLSVTPNDTTTLWTSEDTITVSGLSPNSDYSFRMRSECSESQILDTTSWSSPQTFTTLPVFASEPFVFTFETPDTVNWQFAGTGLNQWIVSDDEKSEGMKSLYVSSNGSDNIYDISSTSTSWAYRSMRIDAGVYNLNYSIKSVAYDINDYVRVFVAPIEVDLSTALETNKSLIAADNGKLHSIVDWSEVSSEVTIPESGYYNLAFLWKNNLHSGYQTPAAIDNVRFEPIECMPILDIEVVSSTSSELVIRVIDNNINKSSSYSYVLSGASSSLVQTDYENVHTSDSDTITLSGLNSLTTYEISLRANCSNGEESSWSEVFSIATDCFIPTVDAANPYFDDFESYADMLSLSGCWTQYVESGTSQWTASDDTYGKYPRSGEMYALLSQGTSSTRNIPYLMRQFYLSAENSYEIEFFTQLNASLDGSAAYVTAGVMRDTAALKDATMFEEMEVETGIGYQPYSALFSVEEDGLYTVIIKGSIASTYYGLTLDDLTIRELLCDKIIVSMDSLTHDYARFTWTGVTDSVRLQIAGDGVNIDTVVSGALGSYSVNNLSIASSYTIIANGVCGAEEGLSTRTTFITECATLNAPFTEGFETYPSLTLPLCWDNSGGSLGTEEYKWLVQDTYGEKYMRFNSRLAPEGSTNILRSMPILVSEPINLSFEYKNPEGGALSFYISTDGGYTYTDTILYEVLGVAQWEKIFFPLDSYIGEEITFVAHSVSNRNSKSQNAYHYLDNVRIICHESVTIVDTTCVGTPYVENGFVINESKLTQGINYFSRLIPSANNDVCDTTLYLELYVPQSHSIQLYETICEGDTYEFDGLQVAESGRFTKSEISSEGCDSVTTLNLTVIPLYTQITEKVCEGAAFSFGGRDLYEAGEYLDTLINSLGCDSIVKLTLEVTPREYVTYVELCEGEGTVFQGTLFTQTGVYEYTFSNVDGCDSVEVLDLTVHPHVLDIDTTICAGSSILFANEYISESGEYIDTVINAATDCEQIRVLRLTVLPAVETIINDVVCQGEEYYNNGFYGIYATNDTVISLTTSTSDGCDSIVTVNLSVSYPTVGYDTVYIESGDVYNFCGNSLSAAGTYECVERGGNSEGCDSTTYLTLMLNVGTNSVNSQTMTLVPNPIKAMGETVINRDWSVSETEGMYLEVLDAVGRIVYTSEVKEFPITVGNIAVSGVYYVRITTGTGEVHVGKLIVQ